MSKNRLTSKSLLLALALMTSSGAFAQTQISDVAGLKAIANNLEGEYILAADITLSGEWTPIGTEESPFKGVLNGNGHVIKGLKITSGESNVGMFSYISGATVKNLSIIGAEVRGYKQAGVLAGQAINSDISEVFTSGFVTGYDHVGGIVGDARGDATNDEMTYISNCFSTAGAYSTTYQAGGIAGWTNAGVFSNNLFLGSASAPSGGAGGMVSMVDGGVGTFTGNVTAAYALQGTGNRVHGICGWKNGSSSSYGDDAENLSSEATIYYAGGKLTTIDELTEEENNEGIQGETTEASVLKEAATYSGIGFDTESWNLSTGSYPALKSQTLPIDGDAIYINETPSRYIFNKTFETNATSPLGREVTITSSNPSVVAVEGTTLSFVAQGNATVTFTTTGDSYIKGATLTLDITVGDINYNLTTAEDLLSVAYNLDGDFTLENDIDMAGVEFSPLGEFTGTFDGKGHYIKNLTYNDADKGEVALFSSSVGATIKNLGFVNANLVGNANVAAVVGKAYSTTISGIAVVQSYIEGRDHVGSIVGDLGRDESEDATEQLITDCISDSEIYSRSYQAGGMVGVINDGTVQNCLFSGIVYCPGNATGIVSLVDSDTKVSTLKNNVVAASHLYGNSTRIVAKAGRKINLENNYVLNTLYYGTSVSNAAPLENQNDATSDQGANVEIDELRSADFYENTLGWDFTNTWKFLDGGEGNMFPVLSWMSAPLQSVIYDLPQNKSILYIDGMEFLSLDCIHGSWGQKLSFDVKSGSEYATVEPDENKLYAGDEDGAFGGRGYIVLEVVPESSIASLFTMTGDDTFSVYIGKDGDQTEISTPEEFIAINKNLGGDYILMNDIDMAGVDFSGIAVDGEPFSGEFDGNGHVIKNIKVSFTSGSDKGVFGKTSGAIFKDIAFVDFTVSASNLNHVGLIGSASSTTFNKVAVRGQVTGSDHVALLAGDGSGCTVNDSYVTGNVTAGSQVGGFFGCTLESGAVITNSYSNAVVSATYRGWVGGFIGLIDKSNSEVTIKNCVSLGDCSSTGSGTPHYTSSFIGGNGAGDSPNATITFTNNAYNVNASMDADSHWPGTNKTVDGGEVEDAKGYNANNFQSQGVFVNELGWDFSTVWTFDTSNGYLYPVLKQFGDIATGVKCITENKTESSFVASAAGNVLTVAGVSAGETVNVVTVAGQTVASAKAQGSTVKVALPGAGLYIVTVAGANAPASVKVVNK